VGVEEQIVNWGLIGRFVARLGNVWEKKSEGNGRFWGDGPRFSSINGKGFKCCGEDKVWVFWVELWNATQAEDDIKSEKEDTCVALTF
jgi:hypothetical protein